MKRRLLLTILLLAIISACSTVTADLNTGYATSSPDHITLTWAGNPATTMTITWRTDTSVTSGSVEYYKAATPKAVLRATANPSNFKTDIQATRLFSSLLTGLSPNTKYTYRVGNGKNWSTAHTFTTADPTAHKLTFLVFGDSQSPADGNPPYSVWHNTLHNAYKANPDAKFIVNVGDLVDAGQSGAHWNGWFSAAAGVIDTIPEMPVVGNHETTGSSDTKRPAYWDAQFKLPKNGPSLLKNQAYSYDYGQVHIVVLDSQQSEQKCYGDILGPQAKWLDGDLAASKATWKIVFFHKGAYSLKDGRDNKSVRDAFSPVIDRYHVDVVFNAHDHAIGRTYPIKGGEIKSKPSQGTVYYVAGRSGTKFYKDVHKRECDAFFAACEDQANYFVVRTADKKLTIKTVKADGTVIDMFIIDKN